MFKKINKQTVLLLSIAVLASLFFSFYKYNQIPPCINADEAAFSYNAYSILKTARDEFGAFMPLRFVSFLDFKLPLYTYFSVPLIALFGLTDLSARLLNSIIAVVFLIVTYKLSQQLFANKKSAIFSTIVLSLSPWMYILTRHAHEGPLSVLFILLAIYFFIRYDRQRASRDVYLANIFLLASVFSYHSARVFLFIFATLQIIYFLLIRDKISKKNIAAFIIAIIFVVVFSSAIDLRYGINRVANLFFLNNEGFPLRIGEYRAEHPSRLIHNKAIESVREISYRYMKQISPEFFVIHGDTNWRFGFENLGLITPIEYFFIFIGLYYLFKKKEKYRWLVVLLLAISPLPNALTWQDASIIRTYILIFPIVLIVGYGIIAVLDDLKKYQFYWRYLILGVLLLIYFFFMYNNWDIYFNHYPKRAVVARAWQCGYKELVDYVKVNYDKFDKFVITDRHGQPYIYLLYYLRYDPVKYQQQAKISVPDKYGFGQIKGFDKFDFVFTYNKDLKKTAYIGYPDQFNDLDIDRSKIKKIIFGTEEMFWIYEN